MIRRSARLAAAAGGSSRRIVGAVGAITIVRQASVCSRSIYTSVPPCDRKDVMGWWPTRLCWRLHCLALGSVGCSARWDSPMTRIPMNDSG